jgi:hypothetical protein
MKPKHLTKGGCHRSVLRFSEYLEILICLLDFHEISDSPKKTQYPIMDRRVSGQPAQSESQKAFNWREHEVGKNKPCPSEVLTNVPKNTVGKV